MSDAFEDGVRITIGGVNVNAYSVASRCTWLLVPAWNLMIDAGWPVQPMVGVSRAVVTHLHADHALGLPQQDAGDHPVKPEALRANAHFKRSSGVGEHLVTRLGQLPARILRLPAAL